MVHPLHPSLLVKLGTFTLISVHPLFMVHTSFLEVITQLPVGQILFHWWAQLVLWGPQGLPDLVDQQVQQDQ